MEELQQTQREQKPEQPPHAFEKFKKTKIWGFIEIASPILAILGGIVLPIILYVYSEKTGQVTVRGIQQTSLIDTKNELGRDVAVLYRNTKIANLLSYTLEVANTWNTSTD